MTQKSTTTEWKNQESTEEHAEASLKHMEVDQKKDNSVWNRMVEDMDQQNQQTERSHY